MGLDVIGAGLGRTGTFSMKLALEQLGFGPCHHMFEVFARPQDMSGWAAAIRGEEADYDALLDGFRSAVDFPACAVWRELAERYPEAKILLTVRPSDDWWRSYDATIGRHIRSPEEDPDNPGWVPMVEAMNDRTFGGRSNDHDAAIEAYEAHNAAVCLEAPSERLLVYQLGSGWEPLCEFLGVDVPDEPFPHTNTTEEWQQRRTAGD